VQKDGEPSTTEEVAVAPRKTCGGNKLYVGGLDHSMTAEKLKEFFSTFGTVTDVLLPKSYDMQPNATNRGFGFITFETVEIAETVLNTEHEIDGRPIKVNPPRRETQPNEQQPTEESNRRVFVGDLTQSKEEDLKAAFAIFGEVNDAVIVKNVETGESRGFGFVSFKEDGSAEKALAAEEPIMVSGQQVSVRKAQPRYPSGKGKGKGLNSFGKGGKGGYAGGRGGGYGYGYTQTASYGMPSYGKGYGGAKGYGGQKGYGGRGGQQWGGRGMGYGYPQQQQQQMMGYAQPAYGAPQQTYNQSNYQYTQNTSGYGQQRQY